MGHPNRGRRRPDSNPPPAEIRALREAKGLTQTQAAHLVHGSLRTWQDWEAGDRRMHPGLYELFRIKVGEPPLAPGIEEGLPAED